jgi:hypothetical protein
VPQKVGASTLDRCEHALEIVRRRREPRQAARVEPRPHEAKPAHGDDDNEFTHDHMPRTRPRRRRSRGHRWVDHLETTSCRPLPDAPLPLSQGS